MNSPKLALERLNEIASEARRDAPLAERSALFAAARFLLDDLRTHAKSTNKLDGYLSEKIRKANWHIAAALGFDIDNSHDDSQHRVWALGQLSTLADLIDENFSDDV